MNIREACEDIMGEKLASNIIADMGLHWCVVAAMADPLAHPLEPATDAGEQK